MAKTAACMPLPIGEFLADTMRLSTEQTGAYLLLLADYWRNGAPPADDAVLGQITRLGKAGWRRHRRALLACFTEIDGRLVHRRLEALRNRRRRGAASETGPGTGPSPARPRPRQARPPLPVPDTAPAASADPEPPEAVDRGAAPSTASSTASSSA